MKKIKNTDQKIKSDLYTKYIGREIKIVSLDKSCREIQQKHGNDVTSRLLSAELEFLEKETLKNFGYKVVPLDDLTFREFKLFPGIFVDIYNNSSVDVPEKGAYRCLYDYPVFDHPYAIYKNGKLFCICTEPYNFSGKEDAIFTFLY